MNHVFLQGSMPIAKNNGDAVTVDDLVGISSWAQTLRRELLSLATTEATVLITGPTGTGKELIAKSIHSHSHRVKHAFIPVDCTCLIGDLFSSHMFGHLRGAFTGAHCDSLGCFRAAHRGTIFLDEVGELQPDQQAKLLRVLEERAVVPVGGVKPIPVDVRIVAATNRDLAEQIRAGHFRQDLYYRLRVLELKTLPLKDHREDIGVLIGHFLSKLCYENGVPLKCLTPAALALLTDHQWPGNVRELRNVLERAVLCSESPLIDCNAFQSLLEPFADPPATTSAPATNTRTPSDHARLLTELTHVTVELPTTSSTHRSTDWPTLDELERQHLLRTLQHTLENQTAAAKLLGVTPRVLSRLIKKHGIHLPGSRRGRPLKLQK
jgi:DNA-binding NtrC family response regulator